MTDRARPWARRWGSWFCYIAISCAFFPYAIALDRYPLPFVDESFFNYPAVSYLDGTGFVYQVRDDVPHGDRLWGYHFPFFPRLQILVLRVFGVGQWSCRITEFLAANIAILVICRTLLGHGFHWSAVAVAATWFGDRSLQEVLNGRMEGLELLCLAGGFWALLQPPTRWRTVLAGWCLASAFGFHPVAFFFPVVGGLWLLCREGRASVLWYFLGSALAAGAFLSFWLPDLRGCVEQFLWHTTLFTHDVIARWQTILFSTLRWSKYWVIGVLVAILILTVRGGIRAVSSGSARDSSELPPISSLATVFAACGFVGALVVVRGAFFPYYVVLFTVWPVIALATELERGRVWKLGVPNVLAAALLVCWVPSLAWNVFRLREMVIHYRQMDATAFGSSLRTLIPPGAPVTGTKELFGLVRAAGVPFKPLPWYGSGVTPSDDTWLVLTESEYTAPVSVSAHALTDRQVVRLTVYASDCPLQVHVVVLTPKRNKLP